MNISTNYFWVYILVSFLISWCFFIAINLAIDLDEKMIFGLSGILIAGSWSFLNIETNKEIRRKDEFVRFFNEYEESVLNFVNEINVFLQSYREYHLFEFNKKLNFEDLSEMMQENESVDVVREFQKEYEADYLKGQGIIIYKNVIDQKNKLRYSFRALEIKSEVIRFLGYEKEGLDKIKELSKGIVSVFSKETSFENIEKGNLYNLEKDIGIIEIQVVLKEMVIQKALSFEQRSGEYVDNKNLALFFIFLGVFLSFWAVFY
tara:strand:+ start:2963 stop:3748 length:786 start_codon:yes stop_codon:yes gene_type:complete